MIAGHATSISLEPVFWEALREAAEAEGLPLNALVARIDAERVDAPDAAQSRQRDPGLAVRAEREAKRRKGAATSGGTRNGRPVALSRIAQVVLARTRGLPSSPMNSTWRSKRAPFGASPTQVRPVTVSPGPTRAQIVDLVADHDPDIGVDMLGRRDRVPVRGRDVLDPAHPGGIVDVAELVDVLGRRGDPLLERRHCARPSGSG